MSLDATMDAHTLTCTLEKHNTINNVRDGVMDKKKSSERRAKFAAEVAGSFCSVQSAMRAPTLSSVQSS